jgi:hypothetical protein
VYINYMYVFLIVSDLKFVTLSSVYIII